MASRSLLYVAAEVLLLVLGLAALVYYTCLLPPKEPRGIPAVPFWVALIPLFKDVNQEEIFKTYIDKPLRTHGAVKVFFGAKWNVVVHRPVLLSEIMKYGNQYQKSGNFKKIPGSVLASFVGDNIISSHGEIWKLYRQVIQPGLQNEIDPGALFANARRLCSLFLEAQQKTTGGIPVQASVQRYTIANFAQIHFKVDFETLDSSEAYLHKLQYEIKRQIFKPIFMNFPFLDRWGLPSRERARSLGSHFTDHLVAALEKGASCKGSDGTDGTDGSLAARLLEARSSGLWTEQQFRDNVTVLFVAGQENPQLAIISTIYLLAKYPDVQGRLYREMSALDFDQVDENLLHDLPYLAAVVLESLRLLPPINQLINRRAAEPLLLGNSIRIPQGTYLGYNCYSTNRDPDAWGADADEFRPERWGSTPRDIQKEYRRRRARAEFISFHGGQRACLGERFALLQIKVTLFELVKRLQWRLDPDWPDRMTPAGPLCPRNLRIVVASREKTDLST
ncbi:hypothetical protein HIM_09595 [Hirsutella minnesotensis 3608]|uniref:Cytochrome P450-DIT2 n=1 Tax=Hirsutella minnesotensis 3608 TaxID=1043627 RepID=A0A0F7ZGJ8_9HYPO|nr:hypothetical protein HIM_09595 [Hirsutella minnesotensis 3608]